MESPPDRRTVLPFGLTLEQVTIWLLVLGMVWALRNFFSIVFMTYIMSYVAARVVGFLTRAPEGQPEKWTRKPVLVIVYLTALSMGYLVAQSVFPLAIEQGKALLSFVNEINLEQVRDDMLAKTVGRMEFTRFKHSENYKPELEKYIGERSNPMAYPEAKATIAKMRESFEHDMVTTESAAELTRLRQSSDLEAQYRQWLRVKMVEPELASNAALRQRLYDDEDRRVEEQFAAMFKVIREQPAYKDSRHDNVVKKRVDQLATERKDRDTFEHDTARARAAERIAALPARDREARFHKYFDTVVARDFQNYRYSYQDTLAIESAKDEAEFRQKLKNEDLDRDKLEKRFQTWKEALLARDHPVAKMVGDTSKVMREWLPEITAWTTHAINNVLTFCLHALLSLMLSFMVVWEIPHMRRGIHAIRGTRFEPVFNEVAPGIARLGEVIGIAFSAQFLIASINAILMFCAFLWLGLGSPVFLALLVLGCCLIPYIGMFLAAPVVLVVALQKAGLALAFQAGIAMLLVHELEAWVLSPAILGEFLNLSPILMVAVLCVAQPLFGIWGLLLGVPVAVYLINDVLLQPARRRDGGQAPL